MKISTANINSAVRAISAATAITMLVACSEPTPEARLAAVGDQLENSSDRLSELDTEIREAEATLESLRDRRRDVRDRVRTLQERLDAEATDVALFRSVQGDLLSDETLAASAISVRVDDGVVTLRGTVRNTGELSTALDIAKSIDGVREVASLMRVKKPGAEPK